MSSKIGRKSKAPVNCVIYGRQLVAEPSVKTQRENCVKVLGSMDHQNWKLIGEYWEPPASGTDTPPQLRSLIHDAKSRRFENILVDSLAIVSLDPIFLMELLVALEASDVSFIAARWSATTHPDLPHPLAFAYLDRDNTSFYPVDDDSETAGDNP